MPRTPRRCPDPQARAQKGLDEILETLVADSRMTVPQHAPNFRLSLKATENAVRRASAWLSTACNDRGVPPSEISRLEICLNEVLANIIMHSGCSELSPLIEIDLEFQTVRGTSQATVIVVDGGKAFDPLVVSPRPRPRSLADAEPGGLGLIMIRSNADNIAYRRRDGRNEFSFGVIWADGGQ